MHFGAQQRVASIFFKTSPSVFSGNQLYLDVPNNGRTDNKTTQIIFSLNLNQITEVMARFFLYLCEI